VSTSALARHPIGRLILCASIVLATSACTAAADKGLAEDAVATFHAQFNSDSFHEIYVAAADDFKKITKESDWVDLLAAVKRKAGAFTSTQQTSWQVNEATYGTAVNMSYDSKFTLLSAVERFSYAIHDGKAVLVGYRIESPTLITK
jgi:hypothetical protein